LGAGDAVVQDGRHAGIRLDGMDAVGALDEQPRQCAGAGADVDRGRDVAAEEPVDRRGRRARAVAVVVLGDRAERPGARGSLLGIHGFDGISPGSALTVERLFGTLWACSGGFAESWSGWRAGSIPRWSTPGPRRRSVRTRPP